MSCKHLQELYELCQRYNLKLTGPELIRIACPICGVDEICPNVLMEEYDRRHSQEASAETEPPANAEMPAEKPPKNDSG